MHGSSQFCHGATRRRPAGAGGRLNARWKELDDGFKCNRVIETARDGRLRDAIGAMPSGRNEKESDVNISASDMNTIRALAGRYSELAALDVQKERMERYAATNALEQVRPVVLIYEIPWGEIRDDSLTNVCAPELQGIEGTMRKALYQWEHFQVDTVIPPTYHVRRRIRSTGIGMSVKETRIQGDTGADISSHEYVDQLQSEQDLAKVRTPEISYDSEGTEESLALAHKVFDGLMDIELAGVMPQYNIWDTISQFRGVTSLLMDLVMRPEFMHQMARRFMEVAESSFKQYEELGLLETKPILLHCTPACTRDLPARDYNGHARMKDVWGRCAAQIFAAVSPEMHDEFDLAYNEKLFGDCGLLYYGCCEPMDLKIDILRKRFKNLRKISITPWADSRRAAENIGGDYVLAAKPNPAFVAGATFNPRPVEKEIDDYCAACKDNHTTLEFVLKDISTIANNPENLTRWAKTVNKVIDRHYD